MEAKAKHVEIADQLAGRDADKAQLALDLKQRSEEFAAQCEVLNLFAYSPHYTQTPPTCSR
jgi:hypothetical protein